MLCERSPFATAPITRATSAVGWVSSATSPFAASTQASQDPRALGSVAVPDGDQGLEELRAQACGSDVLFAGVAVV